MCRETERRTHQFPDGSELAYTVRTGDSAISRIFTAELARRLASADRHLETRPSLMASGGSQPGGRGDAHRSTATHALPAGEVRVSITANGRGSHEYIQSLVRAAAAYTRSLHVEVGRAAPLATLLIGSALALVAVGHPFLGAPLFGAGGVIAGHLVVYQLSVRGTTLGISRIPEPGEAPV
jgi:hypothetical protein